MMLPSGLADLVADEEELARYLTSSSQFNLQGVKPAAFMPIDGETSVFRHGGEPREELWQIARVHALGNRTLYGAAIVTAQHVRAEHLDVHADEPPPRHAVVVRWATGTDPELTKAAQKEQAARLSQRAQLVPFDAPE